MKKSMISIFNQLTHSELADCSLFKNIIEYHYEKFKYFYNIIKNIPVEDISTIKCHECSTELTIIIDFNDEYIDYIDDYIDNMETSYKTCKYKFKKHFKVNITNDEKSINISIINLKIMREDEIYEN